jgi:GNAT superfamily N-acetyltransferase
MLRVATTDDIPKLVKLCEEIVPTLPEYKDVGFDSSHTEKSLYNLLRHENIKLFIIEVENNIDGLIIGASGPEYFMTGNVCREMFFWVRPEARGVGYATILLEAFEDWAKQMGCYRVELAATSGFKPKLVGRMYERAGYSYVGPLYKKEI